MMIPHRISIGGEVVECVLLYEVDWKDPVETLFKEKGNNGKVEWYPEKPRRKKNMETLIAYSTKHGATEKAAKKLAEKIGGSTTLINLKDLRAKSVDLAKFERVAIGGSIYAGSIQKEVKEFCMKNEEILVSKRLGIFICCGNEEQAEEQLAASFSEKIHSGATVKGHFGYEFNFEKLSFMSRFFVKKVSKITESQFRLNEENIAVFAEAL